MLFSKPIDKFCELGCIFRSKPLDEKHVDFQLNRFAWGTQIVKVVLVQIRVSAPRRTLMLVTRPAETRYGSYPGNHASRCRTLHPSNTSSGCSGSRCKRNLPGRFGMDFPKFFILFPFLFLFLFFFFLPSPPVFLGFHACIVLPSGLKFGLLRQRFIGINMRGNEERRRFLSFSNLLHNDVPFSCAPQAENPFFHQVNRKNIKIRPLSSVFIVDNMNNNTLSFL